jgi:hypothetical protein
MELFGDHETEQVQAGQGLHTRRKHLRRIITVTSSLNEISTDQLVSRVVLGGGGVTPNAPSLNIVQHASRHIFKDDMNDFPPSRIFALYLHT